MKYIYCLLMLVALPCLSAENDSITLSGKIANMGDEKLQLTGTFFDHEIALKPDGSFSDTFDIGYTGSYHLSTRNNRFVIHLPKGGNVSLTADDDNFYATVIFSGDYSVENQYLAAKSNLNNSVNAKELYSLNEVFFLAKIKEIQSEKQQLYDQAIFPSAEFANMEQKNLKYGEEAYYLNYPNYHLGYTLDRTPLSATYPKLDPDIDLDNEEDYFFSPAYREISFSEFNRRVYRKDAPKETSKSGIPLTIINTYKSAFLRNVFLKAYLFQMDAKNPDSDKLYTDLMANVTNENLRQQVIEKYGNIKNINPGKPAPGFEYENYRGGKTSLESLRGKYVYIDVWATWCAPCLAELPHLKKIEEKYKDKNITFVSISIDAKRSRDKWKKMILDKGMGGMQLLADGEWNSKIIKEYAITGIPTFILIDPNGNIIDAQAPRPSDSKLKKLFKKLDLADATPVD